MNDKLLGKCSQCGKPLYQDQDGIIFPTRNTGGSWFFGTIPWDFESHWMHECNPHDKTVIGYLIENKNSLK